MPIFDLAQPELLPGDETLRLRRFDFDYGPALDWYRNPETVYLVDGVMTPYDQEKLERMYRYLDTHGELYWIEYREGSTWVKIGDAALSPNMPGEHLPMVIGPVQYRGRGIGRRVLSVLIRRARAIGLRELQAEIYDWNLPSRRCYESVGFRPLEKTDEGTRFILTL